MRIVIPLAAFLAALITASPLSVEHQPLSSASKTYAGTCTYYVSQDYRGWFGNRPHTISSTCTAATTAGPFVTEECLIIREGLDWFKAAQTQCSGLKTYSECHSTTMGSPHPYSTEICKAPHFPRGPATASATQSASVSASHSSVETTPAAHPGSSSSSHSLPTASVSKHHSYSDRPEPSQSFNSENLSEHPEPTSSVTSEYRSYSEDPESSHSASSEHRSEHPEPTFSVNSEHSSYTELPGPILSSSSEHRTYSERPGSSHSLSSEHRSEHPEPTFSLTSEHRSYSERPEPSISITSEHRSFSEQPERLCQSLLSTTATLSTQNLAFPSLLSTVAIQNILSQVTQQLQYITATQSVQSHPLPNTTVIQNIRSQPLQRSPLNTTVTQSTQSRSLQLLSPSIKAIHSIQNQACQFPMSRFQASVSLSLASRCLLRAF